MTDRKTLPPRATFASLTRGDRLPEFTLRVSREDARAYLEATGEPAEHWPEHVPPLALGALALGGLMERVQVPAGLMHTGQEFEFLRAVRFDEPLSVQITVASQSERRGAIITVFATELRSGDEIAGTGRSTVLLPPADAPEAGEDAS